AIRSVTDAAIRRAGAGRRRGREPVRRARARRTGAALRHVALTGRLAAGRGRRLVPIDAVAGTVAGVRSVTDAAVGRPGAGRRRGREPVHRARARRTVAALRHVALTGRLAAGRRRRLVAIDAVAGTIAGIRSVTDAAIRRARAGRRRGREPIRRARARRTGAALRHVALTGRLAAGRGRRLVPIDAVAGTVAGVRSVTDAAVGRPGAGRRRGREPIRRARARRTATAFRHVARTRRRAAGRGGRLVPVDAVPRSVAGVGCVAVTAVRGARTRGRRRGEAVRRAGSRRPRAALRHVARTRRRAADRGRRLVPVHAVSGPVAGVGCVAAAAARSSVARGRRRGESVRRAVVGAAVAALGHVALARRLAAGRGGRLLQIAAAGVRPVADVGHIADPVAGTALGPRVAGGVDAHALAVLHLARIEGADVVVVADLAGARIDGRRHGERSAVALRTRSGLLKVGAGD